MNKRNIIIMFITILVFYNLSTFGMERGITTTYQIFFSEITKGSGQDLGTRYFLYDLNNQVKKEVRSKHIKNVYNGLPQVSLDGKFIVFFDNENEKTFLKLIDINNNREVLSKEVPTYSGMLFMSNDKNYFAFCSNTDRWKSTTKEVYIYDVKMDSIKQITQNNMYDYNPIISPTNDSLVYLQMKDTQKTILKRYYFENGLTEDLKTFDDSGFKLFQWLDNDQLLLTRKENSGTPFLLDLKTGETTNLALDKIYDIKISPDRKMILYLQAPAYEDPTWSLYVSDLAGSNIYKIPQEEKVDIMAPQWVIKD